MNVNSKTGRIKLDKTELRRLHDAKTISEQLWHFLEATGGRWGNAKSAATELGDLLLQLEGNGVDERQLAEVK